METQKGVKMSCDFDTLKKLLRDKGYTYAAEHAESVRCHKVRFPFS